jgi:hypothetical protein
LIAFLRIIPLIANKIMITRMKTKMKAVKTRLRVRICDRFISTVLKRRN